MTYEQLLAGLRAGALVPVRVLGVDLRLRLMTGAEWDAFSQASIRVAAFRREQMRAAAAGQPVADTLPDDVKSALAIVSDEEVLARHLVDERGERVVADASALKDWPRAAVIEAVRELIARSDVRQEDAEKN